ncbi:MAG: PCRF domain-containing protein, partial [Eubacteriales bacterium]
MLDKLQIIESKYSQIEAQLAATETYNDPSLVSKLNKEQAELSPLVEKYRNYLSVKQQLEEAKELLSDPEMADMAQEEILTCKDQLVELEKAIQVMLLPKDPNDNKSVIVEIRA